MTDPSSIDSNAIFKYFFERSVMDIDTKLKDI